MAELPDCETNVKQAIPFFYVSNMDVSIHFYIHGLGFHLTRKWIVDGRLRWCTIEHGEAALMLQEYLKKGHDSQVPRGKLGEGVTIYFQCIDALAIYRIIAQRGIQASKPIVGNGMWETHLTDPDGYNIAFASPTDLPEETEFVEQEE